MQELFLGKEKVSLLDRCPHFRGVLREEFHHIDFRTGLLLKAIFRFILERLTEP